MTCASRRHAPMWSTPRLCKTLVAAACLAVACLLQGCEDIYRAVAKQCSSAHFCMEYRMNGDSGCNSIVCLHAFQLVTHSRTQNLPCLRPDACQGDTCVWHSDLNIKGCSYYGYRGCGRCDCNGDYLSSDVCACFCSLGLSSMLR